MPNAIFILRWDDTLGTILEAKYPDNIQISAEDLVKIYASHTFKEPEIKLTDTNSGSILSCYDGTHDDRIVCIILDDSDSSEQYRNSLMRITSIIFDTLETEDKLPDISYLLQTLHKDLPLTKSQKLADAMSATYSKLILEYLRNNANSTSGQISLWIKENTQTTIVDIHETLAPLAKCGLIQVERFGNSPTENVYLIRDLFFVRVPPHDALHWVKENYDKKFYKAYFEVVKKFFSWYSPSDNDERELIDLLSRPSVWPIIEILKTKPIKLDDLLKESGLDKSTYNIAMRALRNANLIIDMNYNNTKYVILLSKPEIILFFPEYLLKTIARHYRSESRNERVLLRHLELLLDVIEELPPL